MPKNTTAPASRASREPPPPTENSSAHGSSGASGGSGGGGGGGGNLPVHTVRHRNIKATIWRNQTEKGPMYNVTVSRSYRDGEEWRDSHSFGYDDLMNLAKVLYDAHSVISSLRAKESNRSRPTRANRAATEEQEI